MIVLSMNKSANDRADIILRTSVDICSSSFDEKFMFLVRDSFQLILIKKYIDEWRAVYTRLLPEIVLVSFRNVRWTGRRRGSTLCDLTCSYGLFNIWSTKTRALVALRIMSVPGIHGRMYCTRLAHSTSMIMLPVIALTRSTYTLGRGLPQSILYFRLRWQLYLLLG